MSKNYIIKNIKYIKLLKIELKIVNSNKLIFLILVTIGNREFLSWYKI